METMTRAQAIAAGLNTYFTDKPCTNGHIAKRYTRSAACYECIRANVQRSRDDHSAAQQARVGLPPTDLAEWSAHVQRITVRVPLSLLTSVQAIAAAALRTRFPAAADAELRCPPAVNQQAAGTAMVRLLVHTSDIEAVTAVADNACRLFSAQGVRAA